MNQQREGDDDEEKEESRQNDHQIPDNRHREERGNRQEPQQRPPNDGRLSFHEFTPDQQYAWLRHRFNWLFAFAEHFEPMTVTTVEIAIRMLSDYMYSNHLQELPMEHVMRCSTVACLRLAILLNEFNYIPMEELIRFGENRFMRDEIFESEFHVFQSLGRKILTPQTIESCARSYLVLLETNGNGSIANLWEPLSRLIRLAIRDLLFLQYPVQRVGLAAVVLVHQLHWRDDVPEEPLPTTLFQALGIEEGSREAATVIEILGRLLILHLHDLENAED